MVVKMHPKHQHEQRPSFRRVLVRTCLLLCLLVRGSSARIVNTTLVTTPSGTIPDRRTTFSGRIGPFQVRLYWTPLSCWQGFCRDEKEWCLQCEGRYCNEGDILWVEPCRHDLPEQQLFYWDAAASSIDIATTTKQLNDDQGGAHVAEGWGQLQIRDQNSNDFLCLQWIDHKRYELRRCDRSIVGQWFQGLDPNIAIGAGEPFELHPSRPNVAWPLTADQFKCLNMHHHPRQYEEIIHTSCQRAQEVKTNLWEAVYSPNAAIASASSSSTASIVFSLNNNNNQPQAAAEKFNPESYYHLGDPRRDPRCRTEATCGPCQGHCRDDNDCAGRLKCFERSRDNPIETPPGCFGPGNPEIDYCYAADDN